MDVTCKNCNAVVEVTDENLFGKDVDCPNCGEVIFIPLPEPVEEPPPLPVKPPHLPDKKLKTKDYPITTRCPFCREEIILGAVKCKHCHSILVSHEVINNRIKHNRIKHNRIKHNSKTSPLFNVSIVFIVVCIILIIVTILAYSEKGSTFKTKEDILSEYHSRGEFRGYTDPDQLEKDMKILEKRGSKGAGGVARELEQGQ
jgi:hypothetical protein